MIYQTSP
ncbi:periplasmic binding family protein, partial [Vibrio harveyi]